LRLCVGLRLRGGCFRLDLRLLLALGPGDLGALGLRGCGPDRLRLRRAIRLVALPDPGADEQAVHLLARLRALAEPGENLLVGDRERGGLLTRPVLAEDLDVAPIARRPAVGHDDPVRRLLLLAHPHEADLHCHGNDSSRCYGDRQG